jgi:hypothetical protein
MNLLCHILGHKWERIDDSTHLCMRRWCREVTVHRKPVSTLDEIIHDRDWYQPRKKHGDKRVD